MGRIVLNNHGRETPEEIRNRLKQSLKPTSEPIPNEPFVMAVGGLGDLVIAIAASYSLGKVKIVFAPHDNVKPIIGKFSEPFGIKYNLISKNEYNRYCKNSNCLSICHMPPNLDYWDWRTNWQNYTHVSKYYSFKDLFTVINFEKPIIVILPAASVPERSLGVIDYTKLVNKYLGKYIVYATGNEEQYKKYNINDINFHWLTFENEFHIGNNKSNSVINTLRIIHSSEIVFSVDSWLKTYTYYASIPTVVLSNQDEMFIDPKIWEGIVLKNIKELIVE